MEWIKMLLLLIGLVATSSAAAIAVGDGNWQTEMAEHHRDMHGDDFEEHHKDMHGEEWNEHVASCHSTTEKDLGTDNLAARATFSGFAL